MPDPSFRDHFSGHAADYGRYRPGYPAALFDWLAARAPGRALAWDCATGNGQAALPLAERFAAVDATDVSGEQLAQAPAHPRVRWRVAPAHDSGLADASVDLITVAQGLHWFDQESFHAEARRVLRPGGLLAAWCYALCSVDPEVDRVVLRLYRDLVGADWPPERRHVEAGYATLPWPWAVVASPPFEMTEAWDLARLEGYLGTWSAVRRYRRRTGADPLAAVRAELAGAWGPREVERVVRWPLALRVGRR